MTKWIALLLLLCIPAATLLAATRMAPEPIDFPACAELPASPGQEKLVRLGIAWPGDAALVRHVAKLGQSQGNLIACKESWSSILPSIAPWSKIGELERYYGYAAYGLGLIVTLLLLAGFTPQHWGKQPTALGLLGIGLGAGIAGIVVINVANRMALPQHFLYGNIVSIQHGLDEPEWADVADVREFDRLMAAKGLNHVSAPARENVAPKDKENSTGAVPPDNAAPTEAPSAEEQSAQATSVYRTHQPLNLRDAPGVDGKLIALLPRDTKVAIFGERRGDWWQVRTADNQEGWVSSLWLRR